MCFKTIKIIITIIFFLANIQLAFSDELIIPLKKPTISLEQNNYLLQNFIIPKIKPTKKISQKIEKINEKIKKEKLNTINGIIIPKNKPIIVKKQRTTVAKKSIYYSDRDINYARQAIKFMEKGNKCC